MFNSSVLAMAHRNGNQTPHVLSDASQMIIYDFLHWFKVKPLQEKCQFFRVVLQQVSENFFFASGFERCKTVDYPFYWNTSKNVIY